MLPSCNVLDNLACGVEGPKVMLFAQATRPTLKRDANNVVKKIEGVETVDICARFILYSAKGSSKYRIGNSVTFCGALDSSSKEFRYRLRAHTRKISETD